MKKLILIGIIALITMFSVHVVNAQSTLISTNMLAIIKNVDTVNNTGVKTLTSSVVKGSWHTVTVSTVVKSISGTIAGTVILNGSLDGINYSVVPAAILMGAQTATFTLTNVASQTYHWVVLQSPYQYYQTVVTGTGTMSAAISGKYIAH